MSLATRRKFLQGCAAVAATPLTVAAIEPIVRNGTPKFKFSLAAYSYRDLLKSGKLSLSDFIADCAQMQLEGAELTSYYFPDPPTEAYLRQLKDECFRAGLTISGTAVGNDFGYPKGAEREKQIADVCRWIDYAQLLGAPVIRIFAGHKHKDTTDSESHQLMVDGMQQCCDYAGQHGIYLALENHGGPTATAEGILALVQAVDSPWFGVNLDTGNFHSETVYEDLARVAPYAVNVQVKVVVSPSNGRKEPADFKRLSKILVGAGYRGFIVLEYEEKGDPRIECPKYVDQLREAFA
ncbi:MAG: sugar phosphate isomerase/epimerase [Planctomycetales bacterium]|nr:sugar phosphate isomerase/epimerase [Planctomycetales bacterium]